MDKKEATPQTIVKIKMLTLHLEKMGVPQTSIKGYRKSLMALSKVANLDNPDDVNVAIAKYKKTDPRTKKKTNQPASGTYKLHLVTNYEKYVKYFKVENWEKPTNYKQDTRGIQPPTEERVNLLIASAKIPLSIKIGISKETGLRPKEIVGQTGLRVRDIHTDTKTIVAQSLKGCNPRPPIKVTDDLLTSLNNYVASKHLKSEDIIFRENSETYTNHFIRFKNTIAQRLGDPTIKQIRLYDIRHFYVTKQLRRTQNCEIVRQIVGHKNLNTTQKYMHILASYQSGEWIVEATNDRKRAEELLKADFTYQLTTPDGYMLFRKAK